MTSLCFESPWEEKVLGDKVGNLIDQEVRPQETFRTQRDFVILFQALKPGYMLASRTTQPNKIGRGTRSFCTCPRSSQHQTPSPLYLSNNWIFLNITHTDPISRNLRNPGKAASWASEWVGRVDERQFAGPGLPSSHNASLLSSPGLTVVWSLQCLNVSTVLCLYEKFSSITLLAFHCWNECQRQSAY